MQNNILKVQKIGPGKKSYDIFTAGHFCLKFLKFASLTNAVKDIPKDTLNLYHGETQTND